MNDRIEMTTHEENLRDAMHDDELFSRACPSRNSAGEQCALTLHLTGLHTWEIPGRALLISVPGSESK